MFELQNVQSTENSRMLYYAEKTLFDQSHWGDGEIIIPEEQFLYDQIKTKKENLDLTFTQLKIFINWFLNTTGHGAFMLEEDISIIKKIINCIVNYYKNNNIKYQLPENNIKSQVEFVKSIFD